MASVRVTGVGATSAGAEAGPSRWLVLVYRIPSEPTRLRAAVWRRLKSLGAIYLQNAVAALPAGQAAERSMRRLHHDIVQMGGTATLFASDALAGEQTVLQAFQAARSDEYEEIVDRCDGFVGEVEKEYAKAHFSYAELEENEVDHTKLVNWLARVEARDTFGAPGREQAQAAVAHCEQVLEDYAARVYAEESDGH